MAFSRDWTSRELAAVALVVAPPTVIACVERSKLDVDKTVLLALLATVAGILIGLSITVARRAVAVLESQSAAADRELSERLLKMAWRIESARVDPMKLVAGEAGASTAQAIENLQKDLATVLKTAVLQLKDALVRYR